MFYAADQQHFYEYYFVFEWWKTSNNIRKHNMLSLQKIILSPFPLSASFTYQLENHSSKNNLRNQKGPKQFLSNDETFSVKLSGKNPTGISQKGIFDIIWILIIISSNFKTVGWEKINQENNLLSSNGQ
uniref:Uncharacterized protein n=1 Tax=Elaeophora elaphi TaxID=1147741 RepID=A0A0R3RQV4_9BILA